MEMEGACWEGIGEAEAGGVLDATGAALGINCWEGGGGACRRMGICCA